MSKFIIEGFNLNAHLPGIEITVETYPETRGDNEVFEVVYKEKQLSDELTVILHENGQAALEFDGNRSSLIEFMWTEEVADLFNDFDSVKTVDMFTVLERNRIKLREKSA